MRPNRLISAEQLVDELWDSNPPPSAATALRVHVRRLREALDLDRAPNSPSARLPATQHSYVLRVEPDELDAQRFERLVVLARAAVDAGDPRRAVPLLTQAIDLWRGDALYDIADLAAARSEIGRLDDMRAVAIEELADCRLALGEHALVIDVARSALASYPLRERLTASLMLALYRSGRHSEALHAYSDLARRLDADLGIEPTPMLRRLEEDVLLHRSSLDRAVRATSAVSHMRTPIGRFVGRRDELGVLLESLHHASDTTARLVLVRGEAGIGKTTLIEEFCSRAEQSGSPPVVGRCGPKSTTSYQAIIEILRQVVGHIDPEYRTGLPPELGLVVPDVVPPSPIDNADGPEGARFRLFEAIVTTVAELTEPPRVLVIEDLHWADRPTLRLLRHLIRHPALGSTVLVATYRDDDVDGERAEAIEHLASASRRTTVDLSGFNDHEVRALVRATAPPETMHTLLAVAATLHDVTTGNPFLLRELLREFDDQLAKVGDDPEDLSHMLRTIAPAGVRALVDRRLARLSDDANRVLRAAATVGGELDVELLARVCDMPKETALEATEEALAARLLVEDYVRLDCFQFPHALVRNAVYATIPIEARAPLHRSAAVALEEIHTTQGGQLADVAYHYSEAAPLDLHAVAADYCTQVGDEAAARSASADAARWYQKAVEHHHHADATAGQLGRAQLALGTALANDKRREAAQAALAAAAESARSINDARLLAAVALAADNSWALGADFQPDVLALLEEALAAVGDSDDALRVRLLESIATNLYYVDAEREGQVARVSLELAERLGRPIELASAFRSLHLWYSHQPEARTERLASARRSYELACSAPGGARLRLIAQRGLIVDLLENQQMSEFARALDEYETAASELGNPAEIYWAMALRAAQATMHGDLDLADQLARGALLRGHELDQISDGAYFLQRFVIRYQQARLAEEIPALEAAGTMGTVYRAGAALHAVGLCETGRTERAIEVTRRTLGADATGLNKDAFWLAAMSLFAGVTTSIRDAALAAQLRPQLEPCADHVVLFGAGAAMLGSGHQWLGGLLATLGEHAAALAHYDAAVAIAQHVHAPYWEAQAKLDAAILLCADSSTQRQGARLREEAIAIAESKCYTRILKQAGATT